MKKEAVTLKDIAGRVGVSVATVDRALHNRGDINAETRQHILAVANELGYQPNLLARSLVMNKRQRVGVLLPTAPSFFWDDMAAGVRMAAEQYLAYGITLELRQVPLMKEVFIARAASELLDEGVDALLLRPLDTEGLLAPVLRRCNAHDIPIVFVNDLTDCAERLLYFGANDYEAGRTAGQLMRMLLLAAGARGKIGVTRPGAQHSYSFETRFRGFCELVAPLAPELEIVDICEAMGLPAESAVGEGLYPALERCLREMPELIALYSYNGVASDVARCLRDHGRQDLILVAHEISGENAVWLRDGTIDAIVSQNAFSEGYYAMKGLCDFLITGRCPEKKDHYIFTDVFLRENAVYGRREI